MNEQFIHVPLWVTKCFSPVTAWAFSGPYPPSLLKQIIANLVELILTLLARCGVVRLVGMGAHATMKRSATDCALSCMYALAESRESSSPCSTDADTRLDKQVGGGK